MPVYREVDYKELFDSRPKTMQEDAAKSKLRRVKPSKVALLGAGIAIGAPLLVAGTQSAQHSGELLKKYYAQEAGNVPLAPVSVELVNGDDFQSAAIDITEALKDNDWKAYVGELALKDVQVGTNFDAIVAIVEVTGKNAKGKFDEQVEYAVELGEVNNIFKVVDPALVYRGNMNIEHVTVADGAIQVVSE